VSGQIQAVATFLPGKVDSAPSDVNTRTGNIMLEMRKISAPARNHTCTAKCVA